jgi:hypothetical protein
VRKTAAKKTSKPKRTAAKKAPASKKAGVKGAMKKGAGRAKKPQAVALKTTPPRAATVKAAAAQAAPKKTAASAAKPAPKRQVAAQARTSPTLAPVAAPKPKLGQRKPVTPRYFFHTDVPQAYDETYFRAIPRDPEWIFVYWEFSRESQEEARKALGDDAYRKAKRILRVLDVTDIDYDGTNAWSSFDIEITPFANNWYIKVPQRGRTYVVECGHVSADGSFRMMARSNAVPVPRGEVSTSVKGEWSAANESLLRSSGAAQSPLGASDTLLSSASLFSGASEQKP